MSKHTIGIPGGELHRLQQQHNEAVDQGKALAPYIEALESTLSFNAVETAALRNEDVSVTWERFDRRLGGAA